MSEYPYESLTEWEYLKVCREIERLTAENMELHADAMEFDEKLTKVAILRLDLETENIRLQARVDELESVIDAALDEDFISNGWLQDTLAATERGESDE